MRKSLKNRGKHVQLAALHCIGQLSEVTVGATGQGGQVGRISFHEFNGFFDGLQEQSFPCRSSREGCSFGKNGHNRRRIHLPVIKSKIFHIASPTCKTLLV